MKSFVALLFVGFVVSSCSAAFLKAGSEYTYAYHTTVTAGSNDYVSFASAYNITGTARLQRIDQSIIRVKLDDLKFGVYNGEFSYYPTPEFTTKAYQQLNPLTEPFQVRLNGDNLVESVDLSSSIPEWARNIHRGLATTLQLDTQKATGKDFNLEIQEKTVTGECPTGYQIVKTETGFRFSKIRNHVTCANRPVQVRKPGINVHYCPTDNSRDVHNSTSYAVYELEPFNGEVTLKRVTAGSGIMYNLFGSKGHKQYSWASSTFALKEVKTSGFSPIPAPSSPKTYDNLRYVFESTYTDDEELQQPHAYFFHYKTATTDEAVLKKFSDELYDTIQSVADSLDTIKVYKDIKEFHTITPFAVIPLVSTLPYTHLKTLLARFKKEDKKTATQLFLDSLVLAGTGPGALLIKDIVENAHEPGTVARLIAPFPNYIRNPTEKLVKEFETLLKPDSPKHEGRVIEFAFASLINRACNPESRCPGGFVEKYVKYFSDKYDNAESFEDKTVAISGLRNLGLGGASAKILSIIKDQTADRSVRVQAMAAAKLLTPEEAREALLPIFYCRKTHHELRTNAAILFLSYFFDETVAQQMVTSLWTEKCPYVKNFLYSYFEGLSSTTQPCFRRTATKAKAAFAIFPPWKLDRTLSASYLRDYYDREYNFGHATRLVVQKSGESVLPTTIYGAFHGAIASYGTSHLSFFIRLEGLGKALAERIMSMSTGQISFDEVKSIFSKVGVLERSATPLRVELGLMFHGRVVAYHAADQKTITTIPMLLKKLQEMKSSYDFEVTRMLLLGGVTVEQPTEFGTPVSLIASGTALAGIKVKSSREKTGTSITSTSDYRFQAHFFGISQLANHMPAFGSMHTVSAHRTLRARLPRHFNIGFDWKQMLLTFAVETPTEEDPIIAMTHATAVTALRSDEGNYKNQEVRDLLKTSCPTCQHFAQISKGESFRKSRQIGFSEFSRIPVFEGIKRGAKYFDCEKPHSRYQTIKKLVKYFSEDNKNAGQLSVTRAVLGLEYLRDSLFLSPTTKTCGLKAYYYQDKESKSVLEKIEGQVRVKYTSDPSKKLGTKVQFKASLNFKHTGPEAQAKSAEVTGQIHMNGFDKRDTKLRFVVKDEKAGKSGVLCFDAAVQLKKAVDFMSFEGDNEPTFERKINVHWGPEPAGKDACPTTGAYIKATREAHRSQDQVEEAASNAFPYKQCREQKGSANYPGDITPATYECMLAAIDQTNLRESNISIEYQVDAEARNRWKKPMVAIAAFLLPYWDTETSTIAAHAHHSHSESKAEANFVKGSVKMDVSTRKENPTLDIHWHGSQGDEHFHNVDIGALPGPLKVKPVFSRFSPYFYQMFQAGVYGYCLNTPKTVLTFDNTTYQAELTECPTLLAADCDDKPRFAVLSRKLAEDKVGITIHFGEHKLEFNNLETALIDGKEVAITDSVYTDDDEEKIFKFVRVTPTYVAILAEKLSVYVGYTGTYVTVTAGSRYRGTSCGLCGNFDNNKSNDFVGPDPKCKGLSPADMVKAYTVRDGNCAPSGTCPPA